MGRIIIVVYVVIGALFVDAFFFEPNSEVIAQEVVFDLPNDTSYYIDTTVDDALFWTSPECPEDFGSIIVEMPPDFGYETLNIDCGKIVSPIEKEAPCP